MNFTTVSRLVRMGRYCCVFSIALAITLAVSSPPAAAGTAYWNAGTASGDLTPTSVTDVPLTVAFGAFSRGNNPGTEVLNNST